MVKLAFHNYTMQTLGIKFEISGCKNGQTAVSQGSQFLTRKTNDTSAAQEQFDEQAYFRKSKLTCRYFVHIPNLKKFQVSKKIIGQGGVNMKNVLDRCKAKFQEEWQSDFLKLRLRGVGSGFREGPEQQESNEPLHLCISAKNVPVFKDA